jgi:1,4-dihydroxy-6-naphthoate synthase
MQSISLGYSPCPNDTFIFYGLVHSKIPDAPPVEEMLEDIETLNNMARDGKLDMTKISFHAFAYLRDQYCLLHSGGALGRGCGPLVISRDALSPGDLQGKKIAIPGELTTAALLLRLFEPGLRDLEIMPFNMILAACRDGKVDAGVIIHESRFTYSDYGLKKVLDLGEWWEESTGHPIPLGGILIKRNLGKDVIVHMDEALRASIDYAYAHPQEVKGYIQKHAQEMDDNVMQQHIDLYVNEYTIDYRTDGESALHDLYARAVQSGIIPSSTMSLFVDGI